MLELLSLSTFAQKWSKKTAVIRWSKHVRGPKPHAKTWSVYVLGITLFLENGQFINRYYVGIVGTSLKRKPSSRLSEHLSTIKNVRVSIGNGMSALFEPHLLGTTEHVHLSMHVHHVGLDLRSAKVMEKHMWNEITRLYGADKIICAPTG